MVKASLWITRLSQIFLKMQMLPIGARNLIVGPFKEGGFTLQKMDKMKATG